MDDMISKISELLSDPAQAEKIKQIASSLSGSGAGAGETETSSSLSSNELSEDKGSVSDAFSSSDSSNIFSSFSNGNGGLSGERMSRNIALLNAISPYLRPSRASKISSAIRAIQIIDILSKAR